MRLFIFLLIIFSLPIKEAAGQKTNAVKTYVNLVDGYVHFYLLYEDEPMNRLLKDLSKGSCDTCFIYTHVRIFKSNEIIVDSLSYSCRNDKILDSKALSQYQKRIHFQIDTTEEVSIPFGPLERLFQISMEVGKKKDGKRNRWENGYTRNFHD